MEEKNKTIKIKNPCCLMEKERIKRIIKKHWKIEHPSYTSKLNYLFALIDGLQKEENWNKMIKKDFVAIAKIIKDNIDVEFDSDFGDCGKILDLDNTIYDLCEYFKSVNPKFNEVKFKEACLKWLKEH